MDIAKLVRRGLTATPKTLPPVLFYDAEGSALFEEITRTPEYYLTRLEKRIFEANADEILRAANGHGPLSLVELGAGSAQKTRVLLRSLVRHQGPASYVPIDVSPDAILTQAEALEREIEGLRVQPIVGDNVDVLQRLSTAGPARLLLFIGSSIGNYEPHDAARFLREVRDHMRPQDRLLLGTDLVTEGFLLHAAYNDAAGVTARFNLNALARLNREYGADFDLAGFAHRAFFDAPRRRVEMHLVSLRAQRVRIPKLDLDLALARGETIHTENSYKYTHDDVRQLAAQSGLLLDRTWTDENGWFGVHLLRSRSS